jgi:hypothetical protein
MIKLIIAGSRDFNDYLFLEKEILIFLKKYKKKDENVIIISGRARGADKLGEQFADKFRLRKILKPANWKKYSKAAGHIRNEEMAKIATHCIVFWNGESKGTKNMIDNAEKYQLKLNIINIKSY